MSLTMFEVPSIKTGSSSVIMKARLGDGDDGCTRWEYGGLSRARGSFDQRTEEMAWHLNAP
jgi:adenine-specific DNA methylase